MPLVHIHSSERLCLTHSSPLCIILSRQLKELCPEHRRKDLEALIRKEKGNKDKINEQIQNWWDEPVPTAEEKWEDVSKKKKPAVKTYEKRDRGENGNSNREFVRRERDSERGGGGRGYGRSGDRGGRGGGRGSAGGRGSGSDRRGRGRGDRSHKKHIATDANTAAQTAPEGSKAASESSALADKESSVAAAPPVAKPVTARPLQGAWGARAAAAAAPVPTPMPTPAAAPPAPAPAAPEPVEDTAEKTVEEAFGNIQPEYDVGVVSAQDPTPAGVTAVEKPPVVVPDPKPVPVAPSGNVWATKGSAHLINMEKKPLSPPVVVDDVTFNIDDALMPVPDIDLVVEPTETHDDGLSANMNGTMNGTSGWVTESSPVGPVSVDVVDAPLLDIPAPEEIILQVPVVEPPLPEEAPAEIETALKPTSVLNMGHWETGDGEEAVSHDFGFGSFGQENDVTSVDETTISSAANNVPVAPAPVAPVPVDNTASVAAPTVSPARPPPGLGIGMPPMPEKIVHVHELENKLEKTTLNQDEEQKKSDSLPDNLNVAPQNAVPASGPPEGFAQMPQPGVPQQSYANQYGMGMYNYNGQAGGVAAPNGFMGVGAPLGVPPQQKQQGLGQQQVGGIPQQQGSIYGAPAPAAQTQSNETNGTANNESNNTSANPANAGMPPGMAGMAHYNPALFYGQQPYLAGQPHGVSAYGFGYAGQFGGVQAGYGYQQVMGQGAGYGQPYDDQTQHHQGNSHQSGYNNKNSAGGGGGGYRRNNNHHNQQQYQNQYNPQGHGAYGGQPYNMGYNDHFNQRAGYGQQQIDPYMQQNSGGYHQDNDHGKGNKNKGNNRNNFGNNQNAHQYQQGGNQFSGLQGATASDSNATFQGWGNGGL
jgi:hypothetical protein